MKKNSDEQTQVLPQVFRETQVLPQVFPETPVLPSVSYFQETQVFDAENVVFASLAHNTIAIFSALRAILSGQGLLRAEGGICGGGILISEFSGGKGGCLLSRERHLP